MIDVDQRVHGTVKEVVAERFLREAPMLGVLPAARYDTSYREQRMVRWDSYISIQYVWSADDGCRVTQGRV